MEPQCWSRKSAVSPPSQPFITIAAAESLLTAHPYPSPLAFPERNSHAHHPPGPRGASRARDARRCAIAGSSCGATARRSASPIMIAISPSRGIDLRGPHRARGRGSDAPSSASRSAAARSSGALVSAGITEDDISSPASTTTPSVETWLVNWSDADERLLLDIGSHRRDPPRGRRLRRRGAGPDAPARRGARPAVPRHLLGRSRRRACGIDLDASALTRRPAPSRGPTARSALAATGIGFADGWFTGGKLTWTERRQCRPRGRDQGPSPRSPASDEFDLWQRAPQPIVVGDTFRVTAGCDKPMPPAATKFAQRR